MTARSTCLLDATRALYPHLGFAIYAFEPGGPLMLEIHTPDGRIFPFRAPTLEAALAKAFPPEEPPDEPAPTEPTLADMFN